jgi:hypothetical protein
MRLDNRQSDGVSERRRRERLADQHRIRKGFPDFIPV